MLSYYGRWFRTAFTHSMGLFDLWTGLVTAALGVVDHYWPAAQIMTTYAWQIPVWALAAVAAVRLLLAPYWMWSAQRDQTSALEAKVNDGTRKPQTGQVATRCCF